MYDIKPFVPKIYVKYPNKTLVYDTIEDYRKTEHYLSNSDYYKTRKYTQGNPYYICTVCNLAQNELGDYSPSCMVESRVPNYATVRVTLTNWSRYPYKTTVTENLKGHNIVPVVKVYNELGDPIEARILLTEKQKIANLKNYRYDSWKGGDSSPDLRGLLPAERNRIEADNNPSYGWQHKYRHAIANRPAKNYYRRIRSFNERKQYLASQVEEPSPKIRAKRNLSGIPNDWYDFYPHYEKSWKNKKIKKQWMLNI